MNQMSIQDLKARLSGAVAAADPCKACMERVEQDMELFVLRDLTAARELGLPV